MGWEWGHGGPDARMVVGAAGSGREWTDEPDMKKGQWGSGGPDGSCWGWWDRRRLAEGHDFQMVGARWRQ